MIDKIVITDDIFRGTTAYPSLQRPNTVWLHSLVQPIFTKLTDLQPYIWFNNYWDKLELPCNIRSWARSYFSSPTHELVKAIRSELSNALVLTFETSYLLQSALDTNDIPWIDLSMGPLRFLEDLTITFKFSHHFNIEGMDEFFITDADISNGVSRVHQFYDSAVPFWAGSVIFFAQTKTDLTLIAENGFYQIGKAVSKLKALSDARPVFVKPHPFAPNNSIIARLVSDCGAQVIGENTYALLAKGGDCTFATISSSVGHEAAAFGNNSVMFNEKMANWISGRRASLFCYRDYRFWSALLSQVTEVRPVIEEPVKSQPNYFRSQVGYYSLDKAIW
jgi:hypothetical protein